MAKLNWTRVDGQFIYGFEASVSARKAEVIRAYEADWDVYCYIDGKMLTQEAAPIRHGFTNKSAAQAAAAKWLRSK